MSDDVLTWEPTLFGDAEGVRATPRINSASFADAERHQLDSRSWILHVPGFLSGHLAVLSSLATAVAWEQRQRWMFNRMVQEPRLTGECRDLSGAPNLLADIAAALSAQFGVNYDGIWMNWYRDHNEGTGWHADRPANSPQTAIVPVLSIGSPRRFLVRPTGGGTSTVFTPSGGDLIVMGGRCQREWQHCVPKQKTPAGARMSLNFTSSTQS